MKRAPLPLAILSIMLCGCGGSTTTVTPGSMTTVTPATAPSPELSGDAVAFACEDVSLALNPALGSGITCEIVPEINDEWNGNPQYVRIELEGYPVAGYWSPEISVYPVAEYSAMVDGVAGIVANLEALTSGVDPVLDGWRVLPFLFNFDQGQFYYAQYEVIPFSDGIGIRYLTGFTQAMGTFGDPELYTYQAMTDDGRYWVSAVFLISHPLLPDNSWPPEGMTQQEFYDVYDAYVADNVDLLNAQPTDSFTPTIDALDALVSSITITP
ncbi:MAG: hypothetical protein MUP36_02035 [Demequinaceae bacterium]|nr:hypothetical protein [Demequinaceae bacterium]